MGASKCKICGKSACKEHSFLFNNIKRVTQFSGSSPPEIFVGRYNYPNVNIGVLSPQNQFGNTQILSSQELWHKHRLPMADIMHLRSKLVYGRTQNNIRKALSETAKNKFLQTMQEVAMTNKSITAEFQLQKPITSHSESESYVPIISNAAQIKSIRLEENPIIERKIDTLANDTDAKAKIGILELEKTGIPTSTIIKVLSAGLLGLGIRRKLVPTRWAITAVDDTLSKEKLKKIKTFQETSEILVFTSEYLGNHYEFLLLPDKFSFEVIEINNQGLSVWQDYESFFGRKNYAESVTGAYYANRLALAEYLEKIQRQCSCLVFREVNPKEYTQSMGVGILRQISREVFSSQPIKFNTLNEALANIQTRITIPLGNFTEKSIILKDYKKQSKLSEWARFNQ